MPSTMLPAAAPGLPTVTLTHVDEFFRLFEQRRHIDHRLSELAEVIGHDFGVTLPKSGLRIVVSRGGSLVCRGGRA